MGAQDSRLHVLLVYSVNMVKSTWADQPFHWDKDQGTPPSHTYGSSI
jgi:hypothetical protein